MVRFLMRLVLVFGVVVVFLLSWGTLLILALLFVWWLNNQSETTSKPPASKTSIEVPLTPEPVTIPAQPIPEDVEPRTTEDEDVPVVTEAEAVEVEDISLVEEEPQVDEAPVVEAEITPDDLRRIEGIGPKISIVLQDAGVLTFAQLAEAEVATLRQILDDAGIGRIANPQTWPEQSALAAAEDWDGLEVLQNELKGGRRIE